VDFDNDCVGTSLAVARVLGDRLYGVRLDTSETLVDKSVIPQMGTFKPTGVNPQLVRNVRRVLDAEGYRDVKSSFPAASRGEDPRLRGAERPRRCLRRRLEPLSGQVRFTADVVMLEGSRVPRWAGRTGRVRG